MIMVLRMDEIEISSWSAGDMGTRHGPPRYYINSINSYNQYAVCNYVPEGFYYQANCCCSVREHDDVMKRSCVGGLPLLHGDSLGGIMVMNYICIFRG